MFRTILNKTLMIIYYVVGALILEALTFHFLNLGSMPQYFWYNLSIVLAVAIIVFIIPNYTAQYVVYTVLLTLQVVLIYVNYSLAQVYGDLFSIDMIRLIGEAGAAMTSSFVYISIILQLILVFLVIVLFGAVLLKHCKKDKNTIKQHFSIFSIMIILAVNLFSVGFSVQMRERVNNSMSIADEEYMLSDRFLMNTSILKTSSYSMYGTFGYYTNMIANAIRDDSHAIEKVTLDYFNSGKIYGSKDNSSDVFGIDEGNNVIVIMMESLEWFGFGDGTYDPTFENLLYIDDQLEDKTLTPNITKLIYGENYLQDLQDVNKNDNSIIAKNFFAKSKTNMSEGQAVIGNYPIAQALTDIVKDDNNTTRALGYSMPNVLREKGYTTTYVHSHDIDFYSRGDTHEYLGFDRVFGKNNIRDGSGKLIYKDLGFDNWDAEGNFAKNAINYIIPSDQSKPFYTFYLNVSSHGAYTNKDNKKDGDALKYYDYVRYGEDDCELDKNGRWQLKVKESEATPTLWYQNVLDNHKNLASQLVYYQCGVKGLDDAIGIIIERLKYDGIYNKTTMLLFSDHYAYYDSLSHNYKGLDVNNNNDKQVNTILMIISSPGIKEKNLTLQSEDKYVVNNRFTSAYDIIPTLYDLLGVKFNENFYLGHSIFRPADLIYNDNGEMKDMVVYYSNTGGLFGDDIYTFDLKSFVMKKGYTDETVKLFKAEWKTILEKINYISFLNRYNLYSKVTNTF